MRDSLPPTPAMDALADERGALAVFCDFDGTLVDIAPTHDAIVVPEGLGRALEGLAERLDGRFALVSGRSLENLREHLGEVRVAQAGSHGADRMLADGTRLGEEPVRLDDSVRAELRELAGAHDALSLEEKPHGAALHYRADPSLEVDVLARAKEIARSAGLDLKRGKCVVELVHPGANKGAAVRAFLDHAAFADAFPLFIGDDVTDEDGFAVVLEHGGIAIAVGERPSETARYRLASPADVREWLGL